MLERIRNSSHYPSVRNIASNRLKELEQKISDSSSSSNSQPEPRINGEEARKYWKDLYG